MKFGLKPLSILVIACATAACGLQVHIGGGGNNEIKINVTSTSRTTERGDWMFEYQTDGDNLLFAVITEPVPGTKNTFGHLSYSVSSDSPGLQNLSVRKPSGSDKLPLTYQLYQVTPHGVLFTDSRVSAATFQSFLDSNPHDYSIARLLDFASKPATRPTP